MQKMANRLPQSNDITLHESVRADSSDISASDINISDLSEQQIYNLILISTKYKRRYPLKLRPYQLKFIHSIIDSVMNCKGNEIVGLFSRQSGKTESVAASAYLLAALSHLTPRFQDGIRIAVFGPKKEQSDIAFERIINFFDDNFVRDVLGVGIVTRNSTTIKLSNGSIIKSITASKNATIEGETMDLVFVEEAQDVVDMRLLKSIFPMLSSTSGTRVLTGTPTPEHTGYFFYASRKSSSLVFVNDWRVASVFSEKYHNYVMKELKKHGARSDYFLTQYECEWPASSKKFTTPEKLNKLATGKRIISSNEPVFIGIDPAKLQDPTVCSVIDANKNVINWMELEGDNYTDQLEIISSFINQYPNSIVGIDTLGPGEVLYDFISQRFPNRIFRYPMATHQKSRMFVMLKEAIDNGNLSYPNEDCPERSRFEEQLIELDAKWNGNILVTHSPQGRHKHDDYPASLAIAILMLSDGSTTHELDFSVGKSSGRKLNTHRSRYKRRF